MAGIQNGPLWSSLYSACLLCSSTGWLECRAVLLNSVFQPPRRGKSKHSELSSLYSAIFALLLHWMAGMQSGPQYTPYLLCSRLGWLESERSSFYSANLLCSCAGIQSIAPNTRHICPAPVLDGWVQSSAPNTLHICSAPKLDDWNTKRYSHRQQTRPVRHKLL
jgi:hypothetical protein